MATVVAVPDLAQQSTSPLWTAEQVAALAPDRAAAAAARAIALPSRWGSTGADDGAVWGLCRGSGAEAYQVAVELAEPVYRCSCPSRKLPCKHVIALLFLWVNGHVATAARPPFVVEWLARRAARDAASRARDVDRVAGDADVDADANEPSTGAPARARAGPPAGLARPPNAAADRRAIERAQRVAAGLGELDRWVTDRVRTGLGDPALAQYATWDQVAARLVDAQAPALANRVRRLAGMVGTRPGWHEHVLAELGVLHSLAVAGRRLPSLTDDDADLADSVRTAIGWQLRQADVLARPPVTDRWHVAGRSDVLEDRIVVRRTWLRGAANGRWAMLLSFAAYGQSLGGEPVPGTIIEADVHPYPGAVALRVLLGVIHAPAVLDDRGPETTSLSGACAQVGRALAAEPWLERVPITVAAAPTTSHSADGGRWLLADHTGALPIAGNLDGVPMLVACTRAKPASITAEWTPGGLVPLTVHTPSGAVDIGPRGGWS